MMSSVEVFENIFQIAEDYEDALKRIAELEAEIAELKKPVVKEPEKIEEETKGSIIDALNSVKGTKVHKRNNCTIYETPDGNYILKKRSVVSMDEGSGCYNKIYSLRNMYSDYISPKGEVLRDLKFSSKRDLILFIKFRNVSESDIKKYFETVAYYTYR